MPNPHFALDLEVYPNVFTVAIEDCFGPFRLAYEISPWRNDSVAFKHFLLWMRDHKVTMVTYNGISFDYPVLHRLLLSDRPSALDLFQFAQRIINVPDHARFAHIIWPSDRVTRVMDLMKIFHFDNRAKMTSLKALEFAMRLKNLSDLPYPVGTELTKDQVPVLKAYNAHDTSATKAFFHEAKEEIALRDQLTEVYGRDFTNHNDVKIGTTIVEIELEKAGVPLYVGTGKDRRPRQTKRDAIDLNECILPWIQFERPELQRMLEYLRAQKITETKGIFEKLSVVLGGEHPFEVVFGTGGIHGAVEKRVLEATPDRVIESWDVASYYPNLSIQNNFYPEHLGEAFCRVYAGMYEQRSKYPKGSAQNAALKLGLNGTYGKSNDKFSVFYDPAFTMKITLNGQLLLCLLAEQLLKVPTVELVMMNTDGLEYMVHPAHAEAARAVCKWWQQGTKLTLENVRYRRMFIRDVNNYIAESVEGKVKRKGAYEWKRGWHQDRSMLVVPMVAEKALLYDAPIEQTIREWPERLDFMLRIKVPRSSYLRWGDETVQNTTRYYIAKGGKPLVKWMPPLAKAPDKWREIGVESGWTVQVCNNLDDATLPIDHEYYIKEAQKLVLGLR